MLKKKKTPFSLPKPLEYRRKKNAPVVAWVLNLLLLSILRNLQATFKILYNGLVIFFIRVQALSISLLPMNNPRWAIYWNDFLLGFWVAQRLVRIPYFVETHASYTPSQLLPLNENKKYLILYSWQYLIGWNSKS